MFEYTMLHWTTFFTAAILLNLSPGPDIAFILGQTVRGGRNAGFSAMTGIWVGTFFHVAFAAAGLSVILASSANAFMIIKWVGAAYLVYLGISALRSNGGMFISKQNGHKTSAIQIMKQGTLVSLLNPKVAIFFLAFLPQFVVLDAGPVWAQIALHGLLIICVAAVIEPPLVLLGDKLTASLRNSPNIGKWMDRILGTILIGLGIRLAMQQR